MPGAVMTKWQEVRVQVAGCSRFRFIVTAGLYGSPTGRTVYEWEQSLEEVNLYIETPTGLRADNIDCKITPKHLRLGIKGNPPFIDVRYSSSISSISSSISNISSSSISSRGVLYRENTITLATGMPVR